MRARVGAAAVATVLCATAAVAATGGTAGASPAGGGVGRLVPGQLLVSESVYTKAPNIVAGQTQLPPGCTGSNCVTATADGNYPEVFNNALVDGSFGVTSRIFLDELTPSGVPLATITVPPGRLVTSFSSKSELALNLSPDGSTLSFMGYVAKPADLDVSNSNTPGVIDPTNPVPSAVLPGGGSDVRQRAAEDHRDQRVQRQQRAGGDHRRRRRPAAHLHLGQRRERQQPAAERRDPGRRGTADHAGRSGGHAHPGRQLQHHPAGRQGGQDRQGRQLPRPDHLQQRAVLHQGQRRQRRQHRVLPRHHGQGVPERRRAACSRARSCPPRRSATTCRPCRRPGCPATCAS